MCYVCAKSSRIIHINQCSHIKNTPKENRIFFVGDKELEEAVGNGYRFCKDCSRMGRRLKKERKTIDRLCSRNGITYSFNREDGGLDIVSFSGKWKILVMGKQHSIFLFHKNTHHVDQGKMPGYHRQHVNSTTIEGYFRYIVGHDEYRNENPLGKKRKKYKKMSGRKQRVAARRARQRISENYVVNLIEEWEKEQADKAFAY